LLFPEVSPHVASLLLLTNALEPSADVLPALALLGHNVRVAPLEPTALLDVPSGEVILVDARRDLAHARSMTRLLHTGGTDVPMLAILTEGGLAALSAGWGSEDFILDTAGPAEVDARLRLALERRATARATEAEDRSQIRAGDLTIDEATYTTRLRGQTLDLTFKEFELLKYLAQHAGRVFTRAQLLQEVWGYDYDGGTRTVDVHVRRLRAKLGAEYESLIGTVRNVGYKFVSPTVTPLSEDSDITVTRGRALAGTAPRRVGGRSRRPAPAGLLGRRRRTPGRASRRASSARGLLAAGSPVP